MSKTRDYLHVIFIGLLLFLSGAIILGAVSYLIGTFIGIDFISVILYFVTATFLTKQVLKGVETRNKFISIILPIYTALMYILKDYIALLVVYIISGAQFVEILKLVPTMMFYNFINIFIFDASVSGIFGFIINILFEVIEILIMGAGVYYSYKITKQI